MFKLALVSFCGHSEAFLFAVCILQKLQFPCARNIVPIWDPKLTMLELGIDGG